jgi:hypothetical protein
VHSRLPNLLARGLGATICAGLLAACTLLKPSADELSGGGVSSSVEDGSVVEAEPHVDSGRDEPDGSPETGDAGDHPSPCDGAKICGNTCVPLDDPATGCGLDRCAPCALSHAEPGCANGACATTRCERLWGDCNRTAADGCELDLSRDRHNCGNCGHGCSGNHNCYDGQCN